LNGFTISCDAKADGNIELGPHSKIFGNITNVGCDFIVTSNSTGEPVYFNELSVNKYIWFRIIYRK